MPFCWFCHEVAHVIQEEKDMRCNPSDLRRASSWENLSSGFATRVDSNRPAQLQQLGRGLKFRIQKLEVLYYLGRENKDADQTARMRRLICAFVVRIWHKQVLSWRGSDFCYYVLVLSLSATANKLLAQTSVFHVQNFNLANMFKTVEDSQL